MVTRPVPAPTRPALYRPAPLPLHVACDHLSHAYSRGRGRGDLLALDDLSLSIRQHEFVCLVGPSGCGKSTLLRLIAGLEPPTQGGITFGGEQAERGARGGMVVQEMGCFPWMTAVDNVAFGLQLAGVPLAERRTRALAFLSRVGLEGFADHYPHELSVGMRQRLGIGRAIVTDAPLLLMDEPFGALDAQTRRRMQDELLSIWAADRRTVLFVTHDIDEAVRLADRIIVLSDRPGRVVADLPIALPRPRDRRHQAAAMDAVSARIWSLLDAPGSASLVP